MKKILLIAAVAVFGLSKVNAQESGSNGGQTDKGSILVEANTGFGGAHSSNTGFALTSIDGDTGWNVGVEGGYFIIDNLAIKAGLGYGDYSSEDNIDGMFSYKIGAKYYIIGMIPVQVDLNGASGNSFSPMYVGGQAGYAWFLNEHVSVEPGLRYDFGMNEDAGDGDFNPLSVRIGFALHF
ncbi:hypothetical protein D778_01346 [Xanthomarina gelatinilytica]|uniref:Outer membrane protein beta-barrel domain-containing protein n=1 Tax=Xanthomarina gelatinilytica TaxID=1137281 RepID=M7MFT1_9FLAO|nr:hypothetical protein [Xanthomarina gelatinilytica]EMQ93936.1 hypothetical protein D778_01346 [Xanthomarina gelatinilytica]